MIHPAALYLCLHHLRIRENIYTISIRTAGTAYETPGHDHTVIYTQHNKTYLLRLSLVHWAADLCQDNRSAAAASAPSQAMCKACKSLVKVLRHVVWWRPGLRHLWGGFYVMAILGSWHRM